MPPLRLAQFSLPRDPVTLPTGREVACRALSAAGWQVLRALAAAASGTPVDEPPSEALILATVHGVVPDATVAEVGALEPTQIYILLQYAAGALDPVLQQIADEVAAQSGDRSPDPAGNGKRPAPPRKRRARATTSSK